MWRRGPKPVGVVWAQWRGAGRPEDRHTGPDWNTKGLSLGLFLRVREYHLWIARKVILWSRLPGICAGEGRHEPIILPCSIRWWLSPFCNLEISPNAVINASLFLIMVYVVVMSQIWNVVLTIPSLGWLTLSIFPSPALVQLITSCRGVFWGVCVFAFAYVESV